MILPDRLYMKILTHLDLFDIVKMSLKLPHGFSFLSSQNSNEKKGHSSNKREFSPSLKLVTDKGIYRPGELVNATIEICSPRNSANDIPSILINNLGFDLKGIEKLDTQWFSTQKPLPGSRQRRGEHLFLDCSAPSIVSKVILSTGSTRTYNVRVELPNILPPTYRGTTIRYFYYIRSTLYGRWLVLENGHNDRFSRDDFFQLEARTPLQIWVTQKSSNLLHGGNLPVQSPQVDIYWKEKDMDSEWTRADEDPDGIEEEYDSSRDDVSSVSSYNVTKGSTDIPLRSSVSLQSMVMRITNNEAQGSSFPSRIPISQLSVAEIPDEPSGDLAASPKKLNHSSSSLSPKLHGEMSGSSYIDKGAHSMSGPVEPASSEGFFRGRSYNIRIDDQVLLLFSPRNFDSAYYFGDMIGGALTFFHGEGSRRCLEVSVTLETSEIISQHFVHPSRRSSQTITKVQSDHHKVVADIAQTSFLFSIPMDGPMSFSTPYVTVQWALRFEFFTTPKHVDLKRYEHPLLIVEREKGDWVLPITVFAPSPRSNAAHLKSENLSLGSLWIRT
ncbi:uncharacterized protein A4U43_C05F14860 [Asparagus officinalis]|uniref:F-box domain-containing protein n=1 Tax=Asparagus officinalis TaxID=4686 RepID=A0A5P1EVE2_ASPOF|nr:uncharacterized protein LOC109843624 [Asparagus officinalis]ONK68689.1 uncharacterized protein A4U43_C05F14860 [Asparagus officinalis]